MGIKISMYMAFVGGIVVPVLETIRRWHQLSDPRYFIAWFDDYLIGGFLFLAALRTSRSISKGRPYLTAAWGVATGMAFYSFFSQLQMLQQPDPAPVSPTTVAVVKGVMLTGCVCSLILALRHPPVESSGDIRSEGNVP